ncbi:hypothetical protein L596_007127 [Steinernema carpocapsae]|uniref:Uncharacterized protein n=1 Tax=Steinernema carpocapsae TaxID=34508 RepID=A0A4U5P906_STECR|nr:hypothetical protein L596_007127 [Steinernema carpocapsae]
MFSSSSPAPLTLLIAHVPFATLRVPLDATSPLTHFRATFSSNPHCFGVSGSSSHHRVDFCTEDGDPLLSQTALIAISYLLLLVISASIRLFEHPSEFPKRPLGVLKTGTACLLVCSVPRTSSLLRGLLA